MNQKEEIEFKKFIEELHNIAIANKDKEKPEVVNVHDLIIAYYVVSHMVINDEGDALLFLLSLNLINAFIKQPEAGSLPFLKYHFKNIIFELLDSMKKKDFPNMKVNYIAKELNNNNLILFTIYDMQFCYHSVPKIMEEKIDGKYKSNAVFAGIRNKNCINELYSKVLKNKLKYNNLSIHNKPLLERAYSLADDYLNGKISISKVKKICRLPEYCYQKIEKPKNINKPKPSNNSPKKQTMSYILQSRWGEFYRLALDKIETEEAKGKLCTISMTLKQNEEDLNTAIELIKSRNYIPTDKIGLSNFIIVKDEDDKNRLISKLKHPYNGQFIKLR